MNNKKGFSPILILVVIFGILALVMVAVIMNNPLEKVADYDTPKAEDLNLESAPPISDSDDVSTIEEEFNATVTGEIEADLNSIEESASTL